MATIFHSLTFACYSGSNSGGNTISDIMLHFIGSMTQIKMRYVQSKNIME